jgi:hypothetical protein
MNFLLECPVEKPTVLRGWNSSLRGDRKRHTPCTDHVGDAQPDRMGNMTCVCFMGQFLSQIQEGRRRVCMLAGRGLCMVVVGPPRLKMALPSKHPG